MIKTRTQKSSGKRRRRLGRGLGSLLSEPVQIDLTAADNSSTVEPKLAPTSTQGLESADTEAPDGIRLIPVDRIRPNPRQPRRTFDDESLGELASSIRAAGLMQPIIVRPAGDDCFELIAGERRWRAVRMLELDRLPAIVKEVDDQTAGEWALIENLQREDLNLIERAEALRQLGDEFGLTHQELATRVGLNRSSVTNVLRLNELDDQTKEAVRAGLLSFGHAKVLLGITNIELRRSLAGQAVRRRWSVRQLEGRANGSVGGGGSGRKSNRSTRDAHTRDLERRLGDHLGTKVQVQPGRTNGAGRLVIDFFDFDHFEGLMQRLDFSVDGDG